MMQQIVDLSIGYFLLGYILHKFLQIILSQFTIIFQVKFSKFLS